MAKNPLSVRCREPSGCRTVAPAHGAFLERLLNLRLLALLLIACASPAVGAPAVRTRSANAFVFCDEKTVPRKAFRLKGATRFVVADYRPRSERAEDIELGRTAANAVDRLLRDYMIGVALKGEEARVQAQAAKELEVYRLRCVIKDATTALSIGEAMGADLLLWGDAVCPLVTAQGARLVNVITTIEARDNAQVHTGKIAADVRLGQEDTGVFCTRASLTAKNWAMMGSGGDEFRSASVLELGSLELPQVVAGDALGLTLFVGGLHFYERSDYSRALRLFSSASETLRTDSRSAAELLQVMGLTESQVGRFDKAADYFQRCEHLSKDAAETWWTCRLMQVGTRMLTSQPQQARGIIEEALAKTRELGRRDDEATLLIALGNLALHESRLTEAEDNYSRALPLFQAALFPVAEAGVLHALGDVALRRSQLEHARELYEKALVRYRAMGIRSGEANTLKVLGDLALRESDPSAARQRYENALSLFKAQGSAMGQAAVMKSQGDLALRESQTEQAQALYAQALTTFKSMGFCLGAAALLTGQGDVALHLLDLKMAKARYEEALNMFQDIGSTVGEAGAFSGLGDVADAEGHYTDADTWYQRAREAFKRSGTVYGGIRTDWRYGCSLARRGQVKQARDVLTQARQAAVDLGEKELAADILHSLGSLDTR